MRASSHRQALRVQAALGPSYTVVEFDESTHTAQDAANAIGCDVAQIVKSLCFVVNGRATICLVSGANQLDERKLAALEGVGRKQVSRAEAEMVKAATGFTIGGVPPFGHVTSLPVYIDEDLKRFEVVWAAAGTPFAVFAIRPEALERVAGGTAVSLKKE